MVLPRVKDKTVKARREELIRDPTSPFTTSPEKVLGRDGRYTNYAQKKKPPTKVSRVAMWLSPKFRVSVNACTWV